jgi:hypothetical protein
MVQLIQPSKLEYDLSEKNFDFNVFNNVISLFDAALAAGLWHHFVSLLTRRSLYLPELSVEAKCFTGNRHYLGTRSVAIRDIRGSIGRSTEFDTHFNPLRAHLRDRWIRVAVARERGTPLPPVELIRFGKCYFVQDGHHRISVALARGETYIDAEVTAWDLIDDFLQQTSLSRVCTTAAIFLKAG